MEEDPPSTRDHNLGAAAYSAGNAVQRRALTWIGAALIAVPGVQSCSSDIAPTDYAVRITEGGSCEVEGESLACSEVVPKLLSLCPGAKCTVVIELEPRGRPELMIEVFKALVAERFTSVSVESRS